MNGKQRSTERAIGIIRSMANFFKEKADKLDKIADDILKSGEFRVRDAGVIVAEVIIMPVAKIEALQSVAEDIVQHTYDDSLENNSSNTPRNDYNAV